MEFMSGADTDPAGDVHRRRSSYLYGLVITGAVLATAPADQGIVRVDLLLLGTLCIYWAAETFVHWTTARAVLGRAITSEERRRIILDGWPLVAASAVPLAFLTVEGLLHIDTGVALNLALVVNTGLLVTVGYRMARDGGLRGAQLVGATAVTGLLGVAMVVLKSLLH